IRRPTRRAAATAAEAGPAALASRRAPLRHVEQQDLGAGPAADGDSLLVENGGSIAGAQRLAVDPHRAANDLNPDPAAGIRSVLEHVAGGEQRRVEIHVLMDEN